jgi:hypothetical protein
VPYYGKVGRDALLPFATLPFPVLRCRFTVTQTLNTTFSLLDLQLSLLTTSLVLDLHRGINIEQMLVSLTALPIGLQSLYGLH